MKKLFLLAVSAILFLTSCHKWQHQYPEDTERSKDTPMERLTHKWWVLKSVIVNGQDFTDSAKAIIGNFQMTLDDTGNTTSSGNIDYRGSAITDIESAIPIVWRFTNSSEQSIIIGRVDNTIHVVANMLCYFDNSTVQIFTILKLSNSEFKITETSNGKTITILLTS